MQTLCNQWFSEKLQFLFVKFLVGSWVSNELSIFDRYLFIEKSTSLFSLYKICSNFFQSCLIILDFVGESFEKKISKKINCGRWSENVDVTLPDSVFSKEVRFEKILLINVLEILVDKNIRGNKKLEFKVSIKLFIESDVSYFNKSTLKCPRRKIILDYSLCNFSNKGEISSFVKSLIGSVGCSYMQPTILLVNFEHVTSIKVDSVFTGS